MHFLLFSRIWPNEISTTTSIIRCSDFFRVMPKEFSAKTNETLFPIYRHICAANTHTHTHAPFTSCTTHSLIVLSHRHQSSNQSLSTSHTHIDKHSQYISSRLLMDFGLENWNKVRVYVSYYAENAECRRPMAKLGPKAYEKVKSSSIFNFFKFFALTELFYACMCCVYYWVSSVTESKRCNGR